MTRVVSFTAGLISAALFGSMAGWAMTQENFGTNAGGLAGALAFISAWLIKRT